MRVLSVDIGIRNMGICMCCIDQQGDSEKGRISIEAWQTVDIVEEGGSKAKTKNLGMQRVVDLAVRFLKSRQQQWSDFAPEVIVIEQQLSRAATMKVLQFAVYVFCKTTFENSKVTICHAKHKLKVDPCSFGACAVEEPPSPKRRKVATKKSTEASRRYSRNKKMGRLICEAILRSDQLECEDEIRQMYTESKKKDDLADCFLQSLVVAK
jgi:hypothetical protein